MKRFLPIHSSTLKELRIARGWSQAELARRAGYSDRLIRKAELGGNLDIQTIRDIAEALSQMDSMVTFETLVHDGISIAKKFVYGYDYLGREMVPTIEPYLAEDFVFHVAGDPTTAPFIGDWIGAAGMQQFFDIYFGIVKREKGSLEATYTAGDNVVLANYKDTLQVADQPPTVLWVYLHFYFRDGQLYRLEDRYDTQTAVRTQIDV